MSRGAEQQIAALLLAQIWQGVLGLPKNKRGARNFWGRRSGSGISELLPLGKSERYRACCDDMINKAILMGRLTRDPELRNTINGKSVCNFSIAIDDGYGDNRTTSFINCVVWGKTAEFVSNYFSKGKMIIVVGRIQSRSWDGQDGRKNYATEVVAEEIKFGESKKATQQEDDFGAELAGVPDDLPFD